MTHSQPGLSAETFPVELSIVLPCHNEAANVPVVLGRLAGLAEQIAMSCEAIVVDDGSRDGTADIAREAAERLPLPVRVVRNEVNGGYGAALRAGFAAAAGQYIFFTDGDGQFGLGELPEATRLVSGDDAVLGFRRVRQDPWPRRVIGKCWTLLINLSLQTCIRDVDCAFKLIPADILKQADLRSRGALISTEIIAHVIGSGARLVQRPVEHLPRKAGQQTGANPKVILRAFAELVRNLPRLRRIRFGASGAAAASARPRYRLAL